MKTSDYLIETFMTFIAQWNYIQPMFFAVTFMVVVFDCLNATTNTFTRLHWWKNSVLNSMIYGGVSFVNLGMLLSKFLRVAVNGILILLAPPSALLLFPVSQIAVSPILCLEFFENLTAILLIINFSIHPAFLSILLKISVIRASSFLFYDLFVLFVISLFREFSAICTVVSTTIRASFISIELRQMFELLTAVTSLLFHWKLYSISKRHFQPFDAATNCISKMSESRSSQDKFEYFFVFWGTVFQFSFDLFKQLIFRDRLVEIKHGGLLLNVIRREVIKYYQPVVVEMSRRWVRAGKVLTHLVGSTFNLLAGYFLQQLLHLLRDFRRVFYIKLNCTKNYRVHRAVSQFMDFIQKTAQWLVLFSEAKVKRFHDTFIVSHRYYYVNRQFPRGVAWL